MEKAVIIEILKGIGNIGSFATGFAALFGIGKYIKNMSISNELLYGEEARERFDEIKEKLNSPKAIQLEPLPYKGSTTLITPRFEIRKISTNSKIKSKKWNGRRAIIKFYEENGNDADGNKIIKIERWLV